MRHEGFTPMEYANEQLMTELNEFMVAAKIYLFDLPVIKNKPTLSEMDSLQQRINEVLRQDAKPFIRY